MNDYDVDDPAMTELPAEEAAVEERGRSLRRAAYITIGVGVTFSVLYVLSYYMLQRTPGPTATDEEIINFYSTGGQRRLILIGLYVMPFAGIAFLWFINALRLWITASSKRINPMLANVQFVSGVIFTALLFTAAAASAATAASMEYIHESLDPMFARQLPLLSNTILIVFAMRMAAMYVFTTSNIGRATGILPRWFVYMGFAIGLFLLLSATFSRLLALVFPVWVLVLCAVMLFKSRSLPRDATIPFQTDKRVA
jgi:hypothetical protein